MPGDKGKQREVRELQGEPGSTVGTALGDVVRQPTSFRSDAEKRKEAKASYEASEKRKEGKARYEASEKGKEAKARYQASEKGKAVQARYNASEKKLATRARARLEDVAKRYGQSNIDPLLTKEEMKRYTGEGVRVIGGQYQMFDGLSMRPATDVKDELEKKIMAGGGNPSDESRWMQLKNELAEEPASPETDDEKDRKYLK